MNANAKTENKVLMQQAREALKGKWGLAVLTCFVYFLITVALENLHNIDKSLPNVGGLISLIISGPMTVGLCIFCIALSRNQSPNLSQIFEGFKKFWVSLGAYLLMIIFVLLWAILLIIPGIVAALSYSMTFFIIAENDAVGPLEAINKSKQMMYGSRWKLLCLGLRFLGWILLGILTCGIGFLWVMPYIYVSYAKFYEDLLTRTGMEANPSHEGL